MLKHLTISNYALIDRVEISLEGGLTVVTGESGAGKSIMLEALGLLLGSRANFASIRKGEEKCSVEAVFSSVSDSVKQLLKANGLDDLDELIVRRELTSAGRSRAFLNDTPVNLNLLKEVGRMIIDLHGQQENIALQTAGFQCVQLDLFAGNRQLFSAYASAYDQWRASDRKLKALEEAAAQVRKDQDYFQFQFDELRGVDLNQEKFDALEGELGELENAEDIIRVLNGVSESLSDDERGATTSLRWAVNEIKGISSFSPALQEIADRLQSAFLELEDLSSEVDRTSGGIEVNPQQLEVVREKLDEYNRLLHKHGLSDISELDNIRSEYKLKLGSIESFDEELLKLEEESQAHFAKAKELAAELHTKRKEASPAFEKAVVGRVAELGMPKAQFKVSMEEAGEIHALGKDKIQMLFDANGGANLQPMETVASGGEMARLMLALKSIQSGASEGITMILDEIDTGVSGEVAKRIGALMHELGTKSQILAVTHLPGVAARGNQHIKIYKEEGEGQSVSKLRYLDQQQRIEELAGMFSGEKLTEASLESARALLATDS